VQTSDPNETIPSKYMTTFRESLDVLTTSGPPESPLHESWPKSLAKSNQEFKE